MKKFDKVVVIAAYNEEKKIKKVVNMVSKYVDLVIVVDDGSNDRTSGQVDNKKAIVIRHCQNLGQGAALQTGLEYSKRFDPKVVVTYDADGQFEAREIEMVIEPILRKKAEVVLGSRFLGKTVNMSMTRKYILKAGILFTWLFSNIKLTDTHNGFRAFSRAALDKIEICQNRMAHASEIIDQVYANNLTYVEVPVTVKYDDYSNSSGRGEVRKGGLGSFKIAWDMIVSKII